MPFPGIRASVFETSVSPASTGHEYATELDGELGQELAIREAGGIGGE